MVVMYERKKQFFSVKINNENVCKAEVVCEAIKYTMPMTDVPETGTRFWHRFLVRMSLALFSSNISNY